MQPRHGKVNSNLNSATLNSFIRSLSLQVVQLIVESRMGKKIKTTSRIQPSHPYCFNLSIKQDPDVLKETKRSMDGQIPTTWLGMCVEISLKTIDGDTMVLETWHLQMVEQSDYNARDSCAVYNRMSILLKSLIAVTRVTPAYKVAPMQGPDSFVICYRIYMGEPQKDCLGEGHQRVKVGQVGTPIGTLVLTLAYRTQLTITPRKMQTKDNNIMVTSNHFKPNMSPKHAWRPNRNAFHNYHRSVEDELAAACQEPQDPATNPPQCPGDDGKPLNSNANDNSNSPTCASDQVDDSIMENKVRFTWIPNCTLTVKELSEKYGFPYMRDMTGCIYRPEPVKPSKKKASIPVSTAEEVDPPGAASSSGVNPPGAASSSGVDPQGAASNSRFLQDNPMADPDVDLLGPKIKFTWHTKDGVPKFPDVDTFDIPYFELNQTLEGFRNAPICTSGEESRLSEQLEALSAQLKSMPANYDDLVESLNKDDPTYN